MDNKFMVHIEFIAGTDRGKAAQQAIAFAKKLDTGVAYKFNGAEIYAWPTSSESALEQQWNDYIELEHDRPIPISME